MLEVASKQRQEAFRWKCSPSARTHLRRSILDKRADMTTADTLSSHRLRRHTALLIKAALCPDAPPENNGEISEREGESSASLGLHPAPEAEAETLAWRTNPAGFVLAQVPASLLLLNVFPPVLSFRRPSAFVPVHRDKARPLSGTTSSFNFTR